MKVETNLTLIRNQEGASPRPSQPSSPSATRAPKAFELLISQENQQAGRLDPATLLQARALLNRISRELAASSTHQASEVHLLESSCLIRVP